MSLAAILNDRKTMAICNTHNRRHIARVTVQVHHKDTAGAGGNPFFDGFGINQPGISVDVGENRNGILVQDARRRRRVAI